ncbi:hypothetical protein [Shimia sp. SDUM112013]|uniref:hypothetical protein n=1 Tax=Shimia sp. SDUM112013 TaxID=3136160 RepID=UPI0032ECC5B3
MKCHACGEEILQTAKICRHCNSSQNKLAYFVNAFFNLSTLAISLLALLVSFAALYFSRQKEPPRPDLVVQVDRFEAGGFSFFIANLGNLPTVVRDLDLTIKLTHGEGTHAVEAGFSVTPSQIPPGESRLFQIEYSSFDPQHTRWVASRSTQDQFTNKFLKSAAILGNNVHCAVGVYYTSRRYFPNNTEGVSGTVNGSCVYAMQWFAENIGPLKPKDEAD